MRIKFALLIACLTSLLLAPHHAHAFNHYETLSISRPIWNDLSISGEIDHRFDGRRLTRRHFDVGLRHPIPFLGDGWSFRAHYRNVYWFKCGDTLLEKRPYAQIQKTFKTAENGAIPELKWGIRTRQEYRIRDNGNHTARNRSRIKVESQKTILDAKPFIASELFYDMDTEEFTQKRFDIGFALPEFKGTEPSIYYRLDTEIDDGTPNHQSTIIFKIEF